MMLEAVFFLSQETHLRPFKEKMEYSMQNGKYIIGAYKCIFLEGKIRGKEAGCGQDIPCLLWSFTAFTNSIFPSALLFPLARLPQEDLQERFYPPGAKVYLETLDAIVGLG